jgi:hypothetical protein
MKLIILFLIGLNVTVQQEKISESRLWGKWKLEYADHIQKFKPVEREINTDSSESIQFNKKKFYKTAFMKTDSGVWSLSARLTRSHLNFLDQMAFLTKAPFTILIASVR